MDITPDNDRPACPCLGPDPNVAWESIRSAPMERELTDESHFIVRTRRCACGQLWLQVFTELIDWSGGDDSQAHVLIPIDEKEAAALVALDHPPGSQDLDAMDFDRRILSRVWPRGHAEPRVSWGEGLFRVLPHD